MASIQLNAVEKWFGDFQVIKGIDLTIKDGEFVVFVGPSGCGKSTLLRIIAGLEDASEGSVTINDADVTGKLPSERGLAMVFQSYALYPHMNVAENIGFALKTAGMPRTEIKKRVDKVAGVLKLKTSKSLAKTIVRWSASACCNRPRNREGTSWLSVR